MLSNFRQLLLKKVEGRGDVENLVKFIDENYLADKLVESLEKMARSKNKERVASFPIHDFVTEMAPGREAEMIHDALGHHVSRYKAALKSGRGDLANQHAKHAFRLMHLADKAQHHSEGKLHVDFVDPKPWEANSLKDSTWTKGVGYRGNDFSFLQKPPSTSYKGPGSKFNPNKEPIYVKELQRHGHLGAYPFEHIRVNGKYIHVDDEVDMKGFEPHPMDHHPIMKVVEGGGSNWTSKRTPEHDKKYTEDRDKYYNEHPHIQSFYEKHAALKEKDPEAYAKRGSAPSSPVHPEIERAKLPVESKEIKMPAAAASTIKRPSAVKDMKPDVSKLPADIVSKLGLKKD